MMPPNKIFENFGWMKEIRQIIQAFEVAKKQHQKAALATVVHVEGSSYRSPGARMLIREDGAFTGAVSGGCLEGDVLRKALMVIMQDSPLLITYHTTDEENSPEGINLGCNGVIRILIEPVHAEEVDNPISILKRAAEKKTAVLIVTVFSMEDNRNAQQGTKCMVSSDQTNSKNISKGLKIMINNISWNHHDRIFQDIQKAFKLQHSLFVNYCEKVEEGIKQSTISDKMITFLEFIPSEISLVIAGAGNDVQPLVQMAKWMGWETTLIDGRPQYANSRRFAGCKIIIEAPEKIFFDSVIHSRTACLLMSHNYHYDKSMLRQLSKYNVPYIGMLGPQKKKERMLGELAKEGNTFTSEQIMSIYSPAGLDIGAETPEEIACSIVAEISMFFSKATGKSLTTFSGRIHQRPDEIVTAY